MTNTEFTQWSTSLFVAFPSLSEWLKANSPDVTQTLNVWRKCLAPYSLTECQSVLDRWSSGELGTFEAYERDKVHLVVRAICQRTRDLEQRRREQREAGEDYHRKLSGGFGIIESDSGMLEAYTTLLPFYRQHENKEISTEAYEAKKREVYTQCGMN